MAAAHTGLRNAGITWDKVFDTHELHERKVKVVCTIGPACWEVPTLIEMIDRGMNVARLNFSHGDHATHAATVEKLRAAAAERPESNLAILLDTKGPEIRTGFLKEHKPIQLTKGQDLTIVTDYDVLGDSSTIACTYQSLPSTVKPGSPILAADGALVMTVKECHADHVVVRVENDCTLGERKNMNLPGAIVDLPTVTEKDTEDLTKFAVPYGVDFIAASFVRKGSDIEVIRKLLGEEGAHIKIIAKIENKEGLENFETILQAADGIMVARGDLGMEIPPEKVFLAQKRMIRQCNLHGKPVITATQMLESMIKNPRPTRAECTDVANAVLDGTDAVMLSGETAGGAYPLKAVEMMAKVCLEAESIVNYNSLYTAVRSEVSKHISTAEATASSAVKTAVDIEAPVIIVCSESGNTARLISKYRPAARVLVLTAADWVARQCEGYMRGVKASVMGSMIGTDSILLRAIETCREWGWVDSGDQVVAVHGMLEGRQGSTNMCKVLTVS